MLSNWLQVLFSRPEASDLEELLINGTRSLERYFSDGRRQLERSPFDSAQELSLSIQEFARQNGQRLDPNRPAAGGLWSSPSEEDGLVLRWHAIVKPVAGDSVCLSFRRFKSKVHSFDDFHASKLQVNYLAKVVGSASPLFIAGAPGAGKTSLLITILAQFCRNERIIYIDHFPELPLVSPSWLCLQAASKSILGDGAFSLKQVVTESLRLRPERLVLGEIRGDEARALFDCMVASPAGCLTSLHLYHPDHLLIRLADLSERSSQEWRELFTHSQPHLLLLKNRSLDDSQCWQYRDGEFQAVWLDGDEPIISMAKSKGV